MWSPTPQQQQDADPDLIELIGLLLYFAFPYGACSCYMKLVFSCLGLDWGHGWHASYSKGGHWPWKGFPLIPGFCMIGRSSICTGQIKWLLCCPYSCVSPGCLSTLGWTLPTERGFSAAFLWLQHPDLPTKSLLWVEGISTAALSVAWKTAVWNVELPKTGGRVRGPCLMFSNSPLPLQSLQPWWSGGSPGPQVQYFLQG